MLKFTARMILKCFELPGDDSVQGVFVIGAAKAPRVTVLSQQVRAIYLVKCLKAQNRLREGTKIGIVGGGVAGITAACAAAAYGAHVVLYERNNELLNRFKNATHRFIHPHLFDWPRANWDQPEANLPFLSWRFGLASNIASEMLRQFSVIQSQQGSRIQVHCGVEQIVHNERSISATLRNGQEAESRERFEHLFFSVGPGRERGPSEDSYWLPDQLGKTHPGGKKFVVIGTGDGGLIDSLRIRIKNFSERLILEEFLATWNPNERERIAQEILTYEGDARSSNPNKDPYVFYSKLVESAKDAKDWIRGQLRNDTELILVGSKSSPISGYSTPLNRFLYSCLAAVDNQVSLQYAQGKKTYSATEIKTALKKRTLQIDKGKLPLLDRQVVVRIGAESELSKLCSNSATRNITVGKLAKSLESMESLDIFQSYDSQIDVQLGLIDRRSSVPTTSHWSEAEYPAISVLTTRYTRVDMQSKMLVGEHDRRGRSDDSKERYLDRVPISAIDAISTNTRVLLIGQYGSGKSHVINRLFADAEESFRDKSRPSLAEKYPAWKHTNVARPVPVRISALDFSRWLSSPEWLEGRATKGCYALLEFLKLSFSAGGRGNLERVLPTHGLALFLEDWSELPGIDVTSGLANAVNVAEHVEAFFDFLTISNIESVIVVTAVYEPAQSDVDDYPADQRLFARFERFVIADLNTVSQKLLVSEFCRQRGISETEFINAFFSQGNHVVNVLGRTPAGLKQLLEYFYGAGIDQKMNIRWSDLYLRYIEEEFAVHTTHVSEVPSPRLNTLIRLRALVTQKHVQRPTFTRIAFHAQEMAHAGGVFEEFVDANNVINHGDAVCSIRNAHIQDLLVAWGISEGDHLDRRRGISAPAVGVSILDRVMIVVEGLVAAECESGSFNRLHVEPVFCAMRIELDRIVTEHPNLSEWGITIEDLFDHLFMACRGTAAKWIAAIFLAQAPNIVQELSVGKGRAKIDAWASSLVNATKTPFYEQLSPYHRRDIGRALSVLGARRQGVSIGCDALPDVCWISIPPGSICCGARDSDFNLYLDARLTHPGDEEARIVESSGFEIAKYPVTNAQFRLFVEDEASGYHSSRFSNHTLTKRLPPDLYESDKQNCPVTSVCWEAASAFARWLSAFSGDTVTLPTSWEWEYAARCGQEDSVFACHELFSRACYAL